MPRYFQAARLRQAASTVFGSRPWSAQREVHTGVDRYPHVFEAAAEFSRRHIARAGYRLKILSFGCSTGEECFSLLNYFPDAQIDGCDVNPAVLATANSRLQQGPVRFFHSTDQALTQNGPYDVIFCMSSLCLFPDANRPAGERGKFPFANFDGLLTGIDRALRPGGLIVAYNTSYPFGMATIALKYQAIECDAIVENGFVNKLRRDGQAFTVTDSMNHNRAHRIVNDDRSFTDADFSDVLFWKIDDRVSMPPLVTSPVLGSDVSTIGQYTLSDEDVFENRERLLATAIDTTLLRESTGRLYESVSFRRRSVHNGVWLPARCYVRAVKPGQSAKSRATAEPAAIPVAATLA